MEEEIHDLPYAPKRKGWSRRRKLITGLLVAVALGTGTNREVLQSVDEDFAQTVQDSGIPVWEADIYRTGVHARVYQKFQKLSGGISYDSSSKTANIFVARTLGKSPRSILADYYTKSLVFQ